MSLVITTLLLFFLTGCSSSRRTDFDTLYLHLAQNLNTLDPALVTDVAGGRVVANIHANLLRYDPDGKLVGDLAQSWSVSPDARTFTFQLRPEARFADGSPVNADAVVRSFQRVLSPATRSPRTWVLDRIEGARDLMDGKTDRLAGLTAGSPAEIRVTLSAPCASFPGLLTMPAAAIVPPRLTDFTRAGFGAGPYRVKEFVPSEHLLLEANPYYHAGPPATSRVHYRIIVEEAARLTEFRQGRIDILDVPDIYYDRFARDPKTAPLLEAGESANVYYLGFNCTVAPFDDVCVRRALVRGLDRKLLVSVLLPGRAIPAFGPIPPGIPGFDPTLDALPFDLDCAGAELVAAEFDFSRQVRLLCVSRPDTVKIAQVLTNELKRLGLKVELVPYESATFNQKLRAGDFDLYYYSWWADYLDPENFLVPLFRSSPSRSTGNATGYTDVELDALLDALAGTVDPDQRARLVHDIQMRILADAPRIHLWHRRSVTVRQPWVKNFRQYPIYNADTCARISLLPPDSP